MSKKQKKLQKKRQFALWRFYDDGVFDIFIGLGIIWLGIIVLKGWSGWLGLLWLVLPFLAYGLKKVITLPRSENLKTPKIQKRARFGLGLLLAVVLILLLFLLKDEPGLSGMWQFIQSNIQAVLAVFLGTVCFFLAYSLAYQRLYLHGILIFFGFFMDSGLFSKQPFGLAIWAGTIILIAGLAALWQFVRKTAAAL
jgi:hypothetical protein